MTTTELIDQVLSLSREERADLAMRLLESLDEEREQLDHEAAWEAEILRRLEAVDRGEAQTRPAREAIAELRQQRRAKG